MTTGGITSQFEAARERIHTKARQAYAGLVLEAYRRVVLRTPVDTGRARGNWNISTGHPEAGADESKFDTTGLPSIGKAAAFTKSLSIKDITYIVNNLPYINKLEHGSSSQAPVGMVAVTVEEVRQIAVEIQAMLAREAANG